MELLHIVLILIGVVFVVLLLMRAIKVALTLMFLIGGSYLLFPKEVVELLELATEWIKSLL